MMPSADPCSVPVLLLGFNRPEKMRRMITETLGDVRPTRVFVAVDGPRADRTDDQEKCRETQAVAEQCIHWPCELHTLYREENLGCRRAVGGAIDWAFEHVDELAIIEDDCIVDSSFFTFSRVLLDRYRDDPSVFSLAAANFQAGQRRGDGDYYASKYPHCWGWATWKRAWSRYEGDLDELGKFLASAEFEAWHTTDTERAYWRAIFAKCVDGRVDSWAYRWTFSCWKHGGKTLLPNANLVANIGFEAGATHTAKLDGAPTLSRHKLEHFEAPSTLAIDREADAFTFKQHFCPPGSHIESEVLHLRLKELKQSLKSAMEDARDAAERRRRHDAWSRQHPIRAAWRVLRGRPPVP